MAAEATDLECKVMRLPSPDGCGSYLINPVSGERPQCIFLR